MGVRWSCSDRSRWGRGRVPPTVVRREVVPPVSTETPVTGPDRCFDRYRRGSSGSCVMRDVSKTTKHRARFTAGWGWWTVRVTRGPTRSAIHSSSVGWTNYSCKHPRRALLTRRGSEEPSPLIRGVDCPPLSAGKPTSVVLFTNLLPKKIFLLVLVLSMYRPSICRHRPSLRPSSFMERFCWHPGYNPRRRRTSNTI